MNTKSLTVDELEQAILDMMCGIETKIALKPTKLIVPRFMYRELMWRPPIQRAQGMRRRKRAIARRPLNKLRRML